jgi:chemotaxis methyl-accepting protein methylase
MYSRDSRIDGETYFFRNAPQFEALRQHIFPS